MQANDSKVRSEVRSLLSQIEEHLEHLYRVQVLQRLASNPHQQQSPSTQSVDLGPHEGCVKEHQELCSAPTSADKV